MKDNLYAIILAGGSGSRLWPLSRELYPKQLIKFNNNIDSLFQSTFKRLNLFVDDRNIVTVTNIKHESFIKNELSSFQAKFFRENPYPLITEPISKNTAPAIALSIKYIKKFLEKRHDPLIFVTASDNYIEDCENFASIIQGAKILCENGFIVSFGVKPHKPDNGLGYLSTSFSEDLFLLNENALKVDKFIEKPDIELAKSFIDNDSYYWNSGMYMFRASVFVNELKKYSSEIYNLIEDIDIIEKSSPNVSFNDFDLMPNISIDYALMEYCDNLCMLPIDCKWSDLGSWEAIYNNSKKDENNNYIVGNVKDFNSKNSMIYSTSKLVTTIGLENIVVVETEDALLVCDKSKSNEVKSVYEKLKNENDTCHKIHKTVYRPWGYYTVLQEGDGFLTKCICVNPKSKLSLQYHNYRSEHWVVLEGVAKVNRDNKTFILNVAQSIDIKVRENHSLENETNFPLKILEVQCGDILDENDIVRLSDIYGRV